MISRTPLPIRRDLFDPRSSGAANPFARSRPTLSDPRSTRPQ
jgi:hypothetical protein